MSASDRFHILARSYGLTTISTKALGRVQVVTVPMDMRGSNVTERPGDDAFVELEGFPVMTTTPALAALFADVASRQDIGDALMALVDDTIHLVAVGVDGDLFSDGRNSFWSAGFIESSMPEEWRPAQDLPKAA